MKKLFAPFVLFALAGMILSSCSNSSKLSFNKRHYRSGNFDDGIAKTHTIPGSPVASVPIKTLQQISPTTRVENHIAANTYIAPAQKLEMIQNKPLKNSPAIITSNSTKQMVNQTFVYTEVPTIQGKQTISDIMASQGNSGEGAAGAALSLLWIIIVVVLILWLIGILAGGFGLGGLINILLVIALILLILWLLKIW